VAASHLEADKLRLCLNYLQDHHEALSHVVLDAVWVLRPEGLLLPDRLCSLPRQIRDMVALGIRRGATNALASAQARSS
jgi:hypothetical protein